jgi:Fic family protein
MRFLDDLDADLRAALLAQLRDLWTHTSTAIEGNTLTLGETAFVLAEGLTVSGKPLKDHREVVGHARAIDLLHGLLARERVLPEDLFDLHRAVQTEAVADILCPAGAWKTEPNGTHATTEGGAQTFIDYAPPAEVSALMSDWLAMLDALPRALDEDAALTAHADLHMAFVRIHPFCDGNGRMARLLANLPVLRAGWPPILVPATRRYDYIRLLARFELATGQARAGAALLPEHPVRAAFRAFCAECWQASRDLVAAARAAQVRRAP